MIHVNRADFLTHLANARENHPVWFDLPSDQPPNDSRLAEVESRLAAHLPHDYRWFLKEFGGGDFAFASIYSADSQSDLGLTLNQPAQRPDAVVAFSDDGGGNHLVFPIKDGVCEDRVLLRDHESSEVRPTGYSSFLDFLVRVALKVDVVREGGGAA